MNAPETCPALYFGQQCVMDYGHEGIHRLDDAINTAFSDDIADGAVEAHNRASRPATPRPDAPSAGSETPDLLTRAAEWIRSASHQHPYQDVSGPKPNPYGIALAEELIAASRSSTSTTLASTLFTDEDRTTLTDWIENTDWDGAAPEDGKRVNAVHNLLSEFDVRGTALRRLTAPAQPPTSAPDAPATDADVEQLAVIARRAQREWWSKPGDVSEGQKWVYIVREVLSAYSTSRAPSADAARPTASQETPE